MPACGFWSQLKAMLSFVEVALKLVGSGTAEPLGTGVTVIGSILKSEVPEMTAKFDSSPVPTAFTARICIRYSAPASSDLRV